MTTVSVSPGRQLGADGDPRQVRLALGLGHRPGRPVDHVVERGGHPQPAGARAVPERDLEIVVRVVLADERGAQRGRGAGVVGLLGHGLVGDEGRLHDDAGRLVERPRPRSGSPPPRAGRTRRAGSSGSRTAWPAGETHSTSRRSTPSRRSSTRSWRSERPVAHVERLVVDQQADQLAVGHVDQRLALFGIAVAPLGVRQRQRLEEPVQVRAGDDVRLALVEVAAQPDVPVRQGEDRLGLRRADRAAAPAR